MDIGLIKTYFCWKGVNSKRDTCFGGGVGMKEKSDLNYLLILKDC